MSLKFKLDSLEGLDESVAALYSKGDDGKLYLQVDGAVSKTKLDEFRNNNIELLKQLEPFKDIDPKKYADLIAKAQENDDKKMVPLAKLTEMVDERVGTMKTDYEKQIGELNTSLTDSNSRLDVLLIDSAVRTESAANGVLTSAIDDVVLRAKGVYKVVKGKATAHDTEGNVVYSKNGEDTMPVGEWVKGLVKTAPHLFMESHGGGSHNNRGGSNNLDPSKMSPAQKLKAGLEAASG